MLKNRSKQNSYHACTFIHNYRETRFYLEHLIQMILSHTCKNAMLSPPTKTKVEVNDEGSLHSFSICMHDMKNLQIKKISNDQELIQSDPTSCPQNQKGNN